jgi:succinate dehydrogenase hydrophobic anchor subunit
MAKNFIVRSLSILSMLMVFCTTHAQTGEPVAMADTMRSEGKIYVVVAVIVTIFLGLIAYLISLDRKITKLEQETD